MYFFNFHKSHLIFMKKLHDIFVKHLDNYDKNHLTVLDIARVFGPALFHVPLKDTYQFTIYDKCIFIIIQIQFLKY